MSMRDMLKSIVVASATTPPWPWAEHLAARRKPLWPKMNDRAAELGMTIHSFATVRPV